MSEILTLAAGGDTAAFTQLYTRSYKKIYFVAYYSLATSKEAVDVMTASLKSAYEEIGGCKSEEDFDLLWLKKTCEQIIARYREYRKTPPRQEPDPDFIKASMNRLTDAERLAVTIWAEFDLEPKDIASVTGLKLEVVSKKLDSAREKLAQKL